MGRVGNCLLTTFRVIQFILSLVALACGIIIVYTMYSMSSTSNELEKAIKTLQDKDFDDDDVEDAVQTLGDMVVPVLDYLQGTPARAIIVSVAGLWSILVIIYLFFAHRSQNHQAANRRLYRILLELLTLLFWIAAVGGSILLALQYGVMALAGGAEAKLAISLTEDLILAAIKQVAAASSDHIENIMDLIGNIVTIGGVAIASVTASVVCTIISFVSLIVACCTKAKKNSRGEYQSPAAQSMMTGWENKTPVSGVTEVNSPWQTPVTPQTPYMYSDNRYSGRQMV